jgi:hypothetical protein
LTAIIRSHTAHVLNAGAARNSGVIHQYIDALKRVDRRVHQRARHILDRHVRTYHHGATAQPFDFRRDCLRIGGL